MGCCLRWLECWRRNDDGRRQLRGDGGVSGQPVSFARRTVRGGRNRGTPRARRASCRGNCAEKEKPGCVDGGHGPRDHTLAFERDCDRARGVALSAKRTATHPDTLPDLVWRKREGRAAVAGFGSHIPRSVLRGRAEEPEGRSHTRADRK